LRRDGCYGTPTRTSRFAPLCVPASPSQKSGAH